MPQRQPEPDSEQVQLARVGHRYELQSLLIKGLVLILFVVALWVPLQPIRRAVEVIAGEDTEFVVWVNVSVAISLGLLLSLVVSSLRIRKQRSELSKLRERSNRLENEIRDLKADRGDLR